MPFYIFCPFFLYFSYPEISPLIFPGNPSELSTGISRGMPPGIHSAIRMKISQRILPGFCLGIPFLDCTEIIPAIYCCFLHLAICIEILWDFCDEFSEGHRRVRWTLVISRIISEKILAGVIGEIPEIIPGGSHGIRSEFLKKFLKNLLTKNNTNYDKIAG